MGNDPHPLRDALAGLVVPPPVPGEAPTIPEMLTAVVTAVQTTTAPYTVTLRMADGTSTGALPYLGWWAPKVNDVAWLLRQGPALWVLGAAAPANLYVPPAPIIPPTPPAPPPAPPTVRTVPVAPVDMAYWSSAWGWKQDDLAQSGPPGYRAFWFYGSGIAAAKGSGTITGGSIYVQRITTAHGVNGSANVRLGTHGFASRPGAGSAGHGNVAVVGQLARGQALQLPLTAAQIAALNAGAAGLGLEPGAGSYTSADYLRATFGGASGQLSLTVSG